MDLTTDSKPKQFLKADDARQQAKTFKQSLTDGQLKDVCVEIAEKAQEGKFELMIDKEKAEALWERLHELGYTIKATSSSLFSLSKPYKLSWYDPSAKV